MWGKMRGRSVIQLKNHKVLGKAGGLALLAAVTLTQTACSSVPDAVNPVSWYKSTRDWVSGKDEPADKGKSKLEAKADDSKEFPSLTDTPERPVVSPAKQREQIAKGLVADRANSRYAEEVRRDSGMGIAPPPSRVEAAPPPPAPATPAVSASPSAAASQAAPQLRPPAQQMPSPPPVVQAGSPQPRSEVFESAEQVFRRRLAEFEQGRVSQGGAPGGMQPSTPQLAPPSSAAAPMPAMATPPLAASAPARGSQQVRLGRGFQTATVTFEAGGSQLNSDARQTIRQVVESWRRQGGTIKVVGHSSSRTRDMDLARHAMVNFELSAERADAVAQELLRQGVPAAKIIAEARSDREPLFSEEMPAGEAANRRAEIFLGN
jgi:outer membrane protein OmpA-like peptidoglycan-associated protein